ncbi:Uncharacterised protein [Mycobacterium tuberculosis]|nr:Uncharacterised protein [Mycobacterium tuberculosis]
MRRAHQRPHLNHQVKRRDKAKANRQRLRVLRNNEAFNQGQNAQNNGADQEVLLELLLAVLHLISGVGAQKSGHLTLPRERR